MRQDNRENNMLRTIEIIPDYTEMAAGSCLIRSGKTHVLCTASFQPGVPPFLKGTGKGWVTAEYAMLPGATPTRKARDGVKKDGRGVEISRLIGRALRACCDLTRMGENMITLDCDVLQADGGTRTASITGAFVALCIAVDKLMKQGILKDSPIVRPAAAVSVGIVGQEPMLDLCYQEDSRAQVDMNVVMAGTGESRQFVEVQGTGEDGTFSRKELDVLLSLGEKGIEELMNKQLEALGDRAGVIGRKPRLVLASGNKGKIREMKMILGDRFDVVSMKEMGVDVDVEENGTTFEENAQIKARALMEITGCATIADDSGLEVDALNGRPGVYSARYSGVHGDDEANNQKLLSEMRNQENRDARYVCAMALMRPGHAPIVTRGTCEGKILDRYVGDGGFGYDPLFYSVELNQTFAQADIDSKNRVSHRARAIKLVLDQLKDEESK